MIHITYHLNSTNGLCAQGLKGEAVLNFSLLHLLSFRLLTFTPGTENSAALWNKHERYSHRLSHTTSSSSSPGANSKNVDLKLKKMVEVGPRGVTSPTSPSSTSSSSSPSASSSSPSPLSPTEALEVTQHSLFPFCRLFSFSVYH